MTDRQVALITLNAIYRLMSLSHGHLFIFFLQSAILVWIELLSQLYRSIPPAVSWVRFFGELGLPEQDQSLGFRVMLCILYSILKVSGGPFLAYFRPVLSLFVPCVRI